MRTAPRRCRCAQETGCHRCLLGYHHTECSADRKERKQRRAMIRQIRRKQGGAQ